eukprot:TRINITY_DN1480_c0_g3_i1.p1 TRINITY_DN1480_c0_g3~~TRINITY_DN1480_c0_g3_i1.p1  ORF type:complete len:183 (+),score=36.29 TRINITY_DN1480_c0_g3_i1:90-638(+)
MIQMPILTLSLRTTTGNIIKQTFASNTLIHLVKQRLLSFYALTTTTKEISTLIYKGNSLDGAWQLAEYEVEDNAKILVLLKTDQQPQPSLSNRFPIFQVLDYEDTVLPNWLEKGGVFIPMYQSEAMSLSFRPPHFVLWSKTVHTVKVDVERISTITGEPYIDQLSKKTTKLCCVSSNMLRKH